MPPAPQPQQRTNKTSLLTIVGVALGFVGFLIGVSILASTLSSHQNSLKQLELTSARDLRELKDALNEAKNRADAHERDNVALRATVQEKVSRLETFQRSAAERDQRNLEALRRLVLQRLDAVLTENITKIVSLLNDTQGRVSSLVEQHEASATAGQEETRNILDELRRLEMALSQWSMATNRNGGRQEKGGDSGDAAASKDQMTDLLKHVSSAVRQCTLPCGPHGMSINIKGITHGCQCICVADFSGVLCDIPPRKRSSFESSALTQPKLQIPLEREELPAMKEDNECRDAAKKYYLEHFKSEEFRTDRALKFFWELAQDSMLPLCSSETEQVVIVDIGANVGEQFKHWEREFLNSSSCKKKDSLLVLAEPNPLNLAVLRHRVAKWTSQRNRTDPDQSIFSGTAVVRDSAISYYDGVGKFAVNRKQSSSAERGNERGSLDVHSAVRSDPTSTVVLSTRVERLSTALRALESEGKIRSMQNITIPLLKVDAEGYDPAILYGAADILPRTNIVVFECHKLMKSAGFSFRDLVEFFAKHNFFTYKMGIFYWIPVTPPAYWDEVYETTLTWSNCLAVRKGHSFSHMFTLPPPCK